MASWKVDRLSKGMSQKVQIAAVLLSDPELCVLDEPTTGLDPVNVRLVQDLLARTAAQRTDDDPVDAPHEPGRGALRPRGDDQQGQLMVYGAVDEVRREHSLPEVRVHARGPLPAVPRPRDVIDEGRRRGA